MIMRRIKSIEEKMSEDKTKLLDIELSKLKEYDIGTYNHCIEVGVISAALAEIMDLDEEVIEKAYIAGLLHDIGKTEIDKSIINKPGKLTEEEFEKIKEHSKLGYCKLVSSYFIESAVRLAVLEHHEKEDGTGYPKGLNKDNLDIISKIVHVADVYSAIISKRSYKEANSKEYALKELKTNIGKSFDGEVVYALETYIKYKTKSK